MERLSTFRAKNMAKITVMIPAAGTTQKIAGILPPFDEYILVNSRQDYTTAKRRGKRVIPLKHSKGRGVRVETP
jgi:hypothetical protein